MLQFFHCIHAGCIFLNQRIIKCDVDLNWMFTCQPLFTGRASYLTDQASLFALPASLLRARAHTTRAQAEENQLFQVGQIWRQETSVAGEQYSIREEKMCGWERGSNSMSLPMAELCNTANHVGHIPYAKVKVRKVTLSRRKWLPFSSHLKQKFYNKYWAFDKLSSGFI